MPFVPKSQHLDENVFTSPMSQCSGHFLPSLSSHHQVSTSSVGHNRISSVPSSYLGTTVQTDDSALDKRPDRKSQARKFLVGGLEKNKPFMTHTVAASKALRRTQSLRQSSPTSSSLQKQFSQSSNSHDLRDHGSAKKAANMNLKRQRKDVSRRLQEGGKTRKALENWNELVVELNAEQQRIALHNRNHLSVLSESNSDERSEPSPDLRKKPIPTSTFLFEKNRLGHIELPLGLGFTRYRPITPNLMQKLDKSKLTTRKRTQLWVNQLESFQRSYKPAAVEVANSNVEEAWAAVTAMHSRDYSKDDETEIIAHQATQPVGTMKSRTKKLNDFL